MFSSTAVITRALRLSWSGEECFYRNCLDTVVQMMYITKLLCLFYFYRGFILLLITRIIYCLNYLSAFRKRLFWKVMKISTVFCRILMWRFVKTFTDMFRLVWALLFGRVVRIFISFWFSEWTVQTWALLVPLPPDPPHPATPALPLPSRQCSGG